MYAPNTLIFFMFIMINNNGIYLTPFFLFLQWENAKKFAEF